MISDTQKTVKNIWKIKTKLFTLGIILNNIVDFWGSFSLLIYAPMSVKDILHPKWS